MPHSFPTRRSSDLFVGDMLDERQRTRGYAFQTIFIGAGAVLASTAPWFLTRVVGLSNVAAPGEIPITVRYAFYLGAAMLLFPVLWTEIGRASCRERVCQYV